MMKGIKTNSSDCSYPFISYLLVNLLVVKIPENRNEPHHDHEYREG